MTVRAQTTLEARAASLFALLSDYKHAETIIDGLEELTPVGDKTSGVGARFRARMRVGPKKFGAEIEIGALTKDRLVSWVASGGDNRSITFELDEEGGSTTVGLTVNYERPDGLAGRLLASVVDETVRAKAGDTLTRLGQVYDRQTDK